MTHSFPTRRSSDRQAGEPLDYRMVDDGRVKSMTYKVVGKDQITIGGKAHTATKVSNRDGDKETIAWVVDGMPMPVRILQRKDGKDEKIGRPACRERVCKYV